MSKLEDLLPELAGVFAAQESAMENVVSLLTTQVAQLIQSNELQNRRASTLEATQQQLQDALLTMRKAYDALADQQRTTEASHSEALSSLTASVKLKLQQQQAEVEDKWQSVDARLEAAGAGPSETQVMDLVGQHLNAVEGKLAAHLEHRLLETSNRSFLQAQQAEEAMKTELEVLEKKFEYLSRVKMEIKDLNRKIDKQDQTLDDMRMSIELLAKSIGTDESDDEGDDSDRNGAEDDDDNRKQLRRGVDKTEVMNVMKRISLSSTDIQAKINENAAMLAAAAAAVAAQAESEVAPTTHPVRSKSVSGVPPQQAAFARSKTVDVAPKSNEPSFDIRHAATSRRERGHEGLLMPLMAKQHSDSDSSDHETELALSSRTSASILEASEDAVNDPSGLEETALDLIPETTAPEQAVETVVESPEELVEEAVAEVTPRVDSSRSALPEEPSPEADDQRQTQIEVETEPTEVQALEPETPEQAPEAEDEAVEEESEDRVVEILPPTSRTRLPSRGDLVVAPVHAPSAMHHMPTTPNLAMLYPTFNASTAMIRSRRVTRVLKRQHSNVRKDSSRDSSRSSTETRASMATDEIKQLWRRMFTRFVQLKRLQILNGASPDKIFRKQNMSVGARVRQLEETTADLEEMVDVLELNIQANSASVQALDQSLADHQTHVDAQVAQLHEDKQLQGQMIIGVEEKLDLIELDLRRVRTSSRRESGQTVLSGAVSALTIQQQELTTRFSDHVTAFQGVETSVKNLMELELPALSTKFETMLHDFRHEVDHKSKELAKELTRAMDRIQAAQVAAETGLVKRTNAFVSRLYRDLMSLSKTHLVSLEMVRSAKAQQLIVAADGGGGSKKKRSLFDVGLEMLQSIFAGFQSDYQALQTGDTTTSPVLGVLVERATDFQDELEKLKEQSAKAKASAISAFSTTGEGDNASSSGSSSFTDRLVLVTTTQLKALESLLALNEPTATDENGPSGGGDDEEEAGNSDVACQIKDLVVQLRAVLALLFLHSELLDPHQRLQVVVSTQDTMQREIRVHGFALAQLNTVSATVKMMNARLDSFLEMSFSFAKDEDVKKSIQEILSSSDMARDSLSQQLEHTHVEAQKRDEILERELTQLVARVNKKLDKGELLWTQEVLERQLQSVAKSSLGEDDLLDIHRLLRNKLDKTYFNALLLEQRNRMAENGGGAGIGGVYGTSSGGVGAPGNAPLIGAKCISCNSELPPTKAMIKSVVKDQVQQEVAKTLARQQPPGAGVAGATAGAPGGGNASPSFNASTHRSMEKYKKELLAATLQQQQQKTQSRK